MPTVFEFIVLVLAHGQIVDTWLNGSLFATWRAAVEGRAHAYRAGIGRYWWAEMLECSFCMSHWAAGLSMLLFVALPVALQSLSYLMLRYATLLPAVAYVPWLCASEVPLALCNMLLLAASCLALIRAGWILNAYVPAPARYDRGG